MKTFTRLRLHLLAFATALLLGIACDIALPTTTPSSGGSGGGSGGGTSLDDLAKGAACPEWGKGNAIGGSFTADAALNAQIAAFVQASMDIERVAKQSYANVTAACVKMGKDLGVPDDQLQGTATDKATGPCNAVAAKIDAIVKANAAVKVAYQPPRCQMDANFKASCEAECGIEVDPGKVVATCEPAKLSGYCQGTCSGKCEGTCTGECQGTCEAKDAQGRCVGQCNGTCKGSCDATCHAKCEGTWKAPRCEVEVEQSKVKADCSANCEASAKVRASCQPPKLEVQASAQAEAMTKLVATLKANLPALLQAQLRLSKQLAGDIKIVVDTGNKLKSQLKGAGGKAYACVTAAVTALVEASVQINVSVKASASVSAKAGASASGSAG